jgi:putative hemolysin
MIKRINPIHVLSLTVAVFLLSGCSIEEAVDFFTAKDESPRNQEEIYCEQNGGKVETISGENGQYTQICVFADGNRCDVFTYAQGKCPFQKEKSVDRAQQAAMIAQNWMESYSPTYIFDGSGLRMKDTKTMDCDNCYLVILDFQSIHSGYGNREGKTTDNDKTNHEAKVEIKNGEVAKAVTDEKYDELNKRDYYPDVPVLRGNVEGSVATTAGIPLEKLKICAKNEKTNEEYCTNDIIYNERFTDGRGFRLENIPVGRYQVYSFLQSDASPKRKMGRYTEYVRCGMKEDCAPHTPIAVDVNPDTLTKGTDLLDWNSIDLK